MRNLLLATGLTLLASACDSGPTALPDPPILKVTSPARSLVQNGAGKITVTGTVAPNIEGVPVSKVSVNNVVAVVQPDGSFSVEVQIQPGATLLHTEALDADGGKATDTRSVEAGELRAPGSNVENAITTALSKEAFAKIASAAGPLIKGMDLKPMIAPMQPMVHSGDENGPDCLYGQLFIDDVKMSNAIISLVPVDGGLQFSAEIDGLDVPGHMNYAVACLDGSNTTRVTATKVVVGGTLMVSPDGMNGFKTDLANPSVQLTGLDITASGVPGAILNIIPLDSAIQYILPKVAGMFMGPMMNQALGALAGPKQLDVLGKKLTVEVVPSDISFTSENGLVTLDMTMLIDGAQGSKGYIYTDNGMPNMNPGMGLQLGIADDLANEMLSEFVAIGMMNLSMPQAGGTFDTAKMEMTSPPMISADPADGKMRLILPDMMATFLLGSTPVAKAAINAKIDLQITPANSGFGIALQLGTPDINVDVLDDIANESRLTNDDLSTAVKLALDSQIASMSALLSGIPLPAMAGLQMKDLSVSSDEGYVMVQGALQ
jgi:Glucodextranase, domain B